LHLRFLAASSYIIIASYYNTIRLARPRTKALKRFPPSRLPQGRRLLRLRSRVDEALPPRPTCSLLLKPISTSFCPLYRPTCASVLSGHIDSVTVAVIIRHAPGFEALRVTLSCLLKRADHASQEL
jgi:hypothetical protein